MSVRCLIAAVALCLPAALSGQRVMVGSGPGGMVRLRNTDMAVLEAQEPRSDLPCSVTPNRPVLGFDLRFHAVYEVAVPLRALAGKENALTILFRVTPEDRKGEPVHFTQRVRVPPIEEDAKGHAYLHGGFDVGEGDYKVDWLMRDRVERVCSSFWEVQAALPERDKQMGLVMMPGQIEAFEHGQFQEEAPVLRIQSADPLRVKILVNFAPQNPRAATLQPSDTSALVSILRTISREPRIGKFSVVAFNLQEQRIFYRQDDADRIDFPALGDSLDTLDLGTIDLMRLSEKDGEALFLAELMRREFASEPQPDALIFAGPKAILSRNVSEEELSEIGHVQYPVFYMNYNVYPYSIPWRDAIGNAVRFFDGSEYTISRPRDLWYAATEIVSRIVKSREPPRASRASAE